MSEPGCWLVTIDWVERVRAPPAGAGSVSPTQLQSLTEIILLPTRTNWRRERGNLCPNYLSRFSVFNENSCGNSVSIKQVKEKQEIMILALLRGDFYIERG